MNNKIYKELSVNCLESGVRLDKYLSAVKEIVDSNLSRSRIQTLIADNLVLVNGKSVKASYKIEKGDIITLFIADEPEELDIKPQNIEIDIIYQDADLAIINKAADQVVHPAPGHYENTLVNALLYHIDDLSGINGIKRPGIVHRLDKDTTGLIIIAKNDSAHQKLSMMIKDRSVKRRYLALVWDRFAENEGKIATFYGRNPKDRKKMSVLNSGREAITNYKVLKDFQFCQLVRCTLETGRTHQIRVHMKYAHHPIIGDLLYGEDKKRIKKVPNTFITKAKQVISIFNRQALHAYQLEFPHPITGENMFFEAALPGDFKNALAILTK